MVAAVSQDAAAQYIEGNHQVRAGFFIAPGSARFDVTETDTPTTARGSGTGTGFGASGGLEWIRAGRLTWGIELDVATANNSKIMPAFATPIKASTDYTATLRGRLGFYARPDLVLYATAGVGALGTEIAHYAAGGSVPKTSNTNFGGVYGAGLEYHLGSTIFFAEYLRGNYGTQSATITTALATYNYRYSLDTDTVRLGVKFKVGHDWKGDYRHPEHHDPLK